MSLGAQRIAGGGSGVPVTSPHRGSCPWPLTLAPFHLSGQVNQPFLSMSHFALQLALRGPAGPMGLTGRPGPMVSHLGVWGWVPPAGPCPSGSQLTGSEHLAVVGGGVCPGHQRPGLPSEQGRPCTYADHDSASPARGSQPHHPQGSQPHHPRGTFPKAHFVLQVNEMHLGTTYSFR